MWQRLVRSLWAVLDCGAVLKGLVDHQSACREHAREVVRDVEVRGRCCPVCDGRWAGGTRRWPRVQKPLMQTESACNGLVKAVDGVHRVVPTSVEAASHLQGLIASRRCRQESERESQGVGSAACDLAAPFFCGAGRWRGRRKRAGGSSSRV